jgi:hypothetical protein
MKAGLFFVYGAQLALAGSVLEVILLQKFNRWYFGLGPALLRFRTASGGEWRAEEVVSSVNELGSLVARRVAEDAILVRSGGGSLFTFGPTGAKWWSSRIKLALEEADHTRTLSLELRYTLCWPIYSVAACLGLLFLSIHALATEYAGALILFLPLAGGVALYLYAGARRARSDAYRVWELAKHHLGPNAAISEGG